MNYCTVRESVISFCPGYRNGMCWKKQSSWSLELVLLKRTWMTWSLVRKKRRKTRSWKECHHLTTDEEATETWTSQGVHLHCATGGAEVVLPEGGVDPLKEEVLLPDEKGIGARVPDAIEVGPETDDTDLALNPQVTTVVTDIEATQSLLKGLRKATRRAEEEMSKGFILILVQMASCG